MYRMIAVVVLLLLGTVAWLWPRPIPPPVPVPVSTGAIPANAATADTPAMPAPKAGASATPAPDFAQRRAELEQRAARGDAQAAARLGGMLLTCRRYAPVTAARIEQAVIDGMADGLELKLGDTPVSPELLVLALQQGQDKKDQICAGSEKQVKWDDGRQAMQLLAQAADAGQTQAMLDFAHHAFSDYHRADEMLRDAAGVKQRRDKARAYLQQALQAGDAGALMELANAYSNGGVYDKNMPAAYTHLLAFFQSEAAKNWSPRLRELYLQSLSRELTKDQLAQAQEQAHALYLQVQAGGQR